MKTSTIPQEPIILYQFPPVWKLLNASPFCMRLEVYFKLAKWPYQIVHVSDPRKGPKGKLPYIKDGEVVMGDSGLILTYLKDKYGDPLDAKLSPSEKAIALAFERLMNEHFYWTALSARWFDPRNWPILKKKYFSHLPPIVRTLLPEILKRAMDKERFGHGIGRHSLSEIYELGKSDLTALSDFLADKPFFMGSTPTTLDATAYAYLANILFVPIESPLKTHAESLANFAPYCARMKALVG